MPLFDEAFSLDGDLALQKDGCDFNSEHRQVQSFTIVSDASKLPTNEASFDIFLKGLSEQKSSGNSFAIDTDKLNEMGNSCIVIKVCPYCHPTGCKDPKCDMNDANTLLAPAPKRIKTEVKDEPLHVNTDAVKVGAIDEKPIEVLSGYFNGEVRHIEIDMLGEIMDCAGLILCCLLYTTLQVNAFRSMEELKTGCESLKHEGGTEHKDVVLSGGDRIWSAYPFEDKMDQNSNFPIGDFDLLRDLSYILLSDEEVDIEMMLSSPRVMDENNLLIIPNLADSSLCSASSTWLT